MERRVFERERIFEFGKEAILIMETFIDGSLRYAAWKRFSEVA